MQPMMRKAKVVGSKMFTPVFTRRRITKAPYLSRTGLRPRRIQ
jgi:hypothetical protein